MKLLIGNKKFISILFILILLNAISIMVTPLLLNYWIKNNITIEIQNILLIIALLIGSYLIKIMIIFLREHFAVTFNINQALTLTKKFFGLNYDVINEKGPTYFLERISISVQSFYIYLSDAFVKFIVNILIAFSIIILTFTFNKHLALIFIILLPVNLFGYKLLNKELQKRSKIMQETTSEGWKDVINICRNTDYIKQMGEKDKLFLNIREPYFKIYDSIAKVNSFAQIISTTLTSFNELMKSLMILLLAYIIFSEGGSLLLIVLLSIIMPIYFNAINEIVHANLASRDLKNSLEFINYLETNQEVDGKNIIYSIDEITFNIKDLPIGKHTVKIDINETFKKGDIVAVNGDSGTGKSSLIKLLPKFRTTNYIYINGIDIRDIDNKSLRSSLEYMSQDVPIITGTIKENIFLGLPVNKERLQRLQKEPLLQSIFDNNKSLETIITENGANLSGGEKQKIAVIRSLYSNADVFILDEITSNIDKDTSKEIYKTITSMHKDKIIFIISHDKEHLPYCNRSINFGVKEASNRI